MKKLILIRHGETDYTLQRKYCGHEDVPLNTKGVEQCRRLFVRLKNMKVDSVYSSDLKRALQTAEILFPNRIIFRRKALREIDFGRFSGLTFEEAERIYPHTYKLWLGNPIKARIPRGESLPEFARRVRRSFKRIWDKNPKKVVALVSHGGTIRIILLKMLGKGLDKFWDLEQATAALNIVDFKNGIPKITRINDTTQ